jgi:hypothetical protein
MQHEAYCQFKAIGHTDAAKRISDTYNLHRIGLGDGAIGQYFAAALVDGRSDNQVYATKRDAVRHQHHNEDYFTFIRIGPQSMKTCDAEVMLKTARALYNRDIRLADPDDARGGRDVIKRVSVEDQLAQSRGLNTNLIMPWEA